MESDFERYYHRDLGGLWRGEMTPRKAATLAVNLPPGACVWAAAGTDTAWTAETHMLANAVDVLVGANWQRSGGDGTQPQPFPRPGDEHRRAGLESSASSRAARFRARQHKEDGGS